MRRNSILTMVLMLVAASTCIGQVPLPSEISDAGCRTLQQRYFGILKSVGEEVRSHRYPYPFYLSNVIDIDQAMEPTVDQRSIRFGRYEGRRMLTITGNYFASYSAAAMDRSQRARRTFHDVILPILKAVVPALANAEEFQGYAIEVSHHVRLKVLGVMSENPENVVLIISRETAARLVAAQTIDQQQAALLDTESFFDGEPFLLWLRDDVNPPADWHPRERARPIHSKKESVVESKADLSPASEGDLVSPHLLQLPELPVHVVDAKALGDLDAHYMDILTRIVHDLDSQAHFLSYAPPTFVSFRKAAYLQLAMSASISSPAVSQYRLAAVAFDQRVSHLVRPVLQYFQDDTDFDGIGFSVTVHASDAGKDNVLAVEYFIPLRSLRCYANYDCTGQQILNSGIVLINGDPVGLDLQKAEEISVAASN